jgi:hypothetical protein
MVPSSCGDRMLGAFNNHSIARPQHRPSLSAYEAASTEPSQAYYHYREIDSRDICGVNSGYSAGPVHGLLLNCASRADLGSMHLPARRDRILSREFRGRGRGREHEGIDCGYHCDNFFGVDSETAPIVAKPTSYGRSSLARLGPGFLSRCLPTTSTSRNALQYATYLPQKAKDSC